MKTKNNDHVQNYVQDLDGYHEFQEQNNPKKIHPDDPHRL
jgi:hypothetical protein